MEEILRKYKLKKKYSNIVVSSGKSEMHLGMLIPSMTVFKNIPIVNKVSFIIAFYPFLNTGYYLLATD